MNAKCLSKVFMDALSVYGVQTRTDRERKMRSVN
jgi:hypothetical protein